MNLYLTADRIGIASGGGVVTQNELQALQEFSQESGDGGTIALSIDHTVHYPTPFAQDEYLLQHVKRLPEIPRITHCYSGCLTNTLQYLRQKGSKIVYTAAAHSVALSRQAHEEMGVPYDYPHLNDPVLWERYLEGYKTAHALVCPSRHSRDVMRGFGCTQPIHVIPHGIYPSGARVWSPPRIFTVGYLGSYGPDKGIPTLLRAWSRLKLPDAKLILAGRDSRTSYVQRLLFQNCPDSSNVECLGWLESITPFYESLSAYTQNSISEGFGIEVLEAMSHGVPVLCSDHAGACDLVPSNYHFRAGDHNQLADKLTQLRSILQAGNHDTISRNWRDIGSYYSWDRVRGMYRDLWRTLA